MRHRGRRAHCTCTGTPRLAGIETTTNTPQLRLPPAPETSATGPRSSLDELNAKYAIKDSVHFEKNEHGLIKAVLTHFNGRRANEPFPRRLWLLSGAAARCHVIVIRRPPTSC